MIYAPEPGVDIGYDEPKKFRPPGGVPVKEFPLKKVVQTSEEKRVANQLERFKQKREEREIEIEME